MRKLLCLTLVAISCGCPGQRRPPPVKEPAARPSDPTPPLGDPAATPAPLGSGVQGLRNGLQEVKRLKARYSASDQGREGHERLMARINALQTRGFDLQETAEGAELDELYSLLEEIEVLRDEVVALEPGLSPEPKEQAAPH